MSWLGKILFKGIGWKVKGDPSNDLPKRLFVVIPHTSNWDFPIGIFVRMYKDIDVGYIAKSSLFKWPYGWLFRKTGGIPVDRKKTSGFIDSVVHIYNTRKRFSTAIAPEGTRKRVDRLKSGFYHIASQANIPIVYTKFDWKNRTVEFSEPHYVEDTYEEELIYLREFFKGVVGKVPSGQGNW